VPSTRLPVAVAAAAVIALASAGCSSRPSSGPSTAGATGQRTINVAMVDNAYQPDTPITVATGDKVKFVFHNTGKLPHEAVLGDIAAQNAHEQEMAKPGGMGGMDHGQRDAGAIDVPAGRTSSLTYTFAAPGQLIIGCHYPGHYASMHIPVSVS